MARARATVVPRRTHGAIRGPYPPEQTPHPSRPRRAWCYPEGVVGKSGEPARIPALAAHFARMTQREATGDRPLASAGRVRPSGGIRSVVRTPPRSRWRFPLSAVGRPPRIPNGVRRPSPENPEARSQRSEKCDATTLSDLAEPARRWHPVGDTRSTAGNAGPEPGSLRATMPVSIRPRNSSDDPKKRPEGKVPGERSPTARPRDRPGH